MGFEGVRSNFFVFFFFHKLFEGCFSIFLFFSVLLRVCFKVFLRFYFLLFRCFKEFFSCLCFWCVIGFV